jgi:hypothetical protein
VPQQSTKGVDMGFDDIVNKGKEMFEDAKDKVEETFGKDKVEEVSDKVLDGAADVAKKVAPDQFDGTVDDVRNNVDKAIGNE